MQNIISIRAVTLFLATIAAWAALVVPALVFAQGVTGELGYFGSFFSEVLDLINTILIPLMFGLLILGFFWGVFTYFILGGADEGKREEGRKLMLYAIIGFVVVVALYGIIQIIQQAFGLDTFSGTVNVPTGPSTR